MVQDEAYSDRGAASCSNRVSCEWMRALPLAIATLLASPALSAPLEFELGGGLGRVFGESYPWAPVVSGRGGSTPPGFRRGGRPGRLGGSGRWGGLPGRLALRGGRPPLSPERAERPATRPRRSSSIC